MRRVLGVAAGLLLVGSVVGLGIPSTTPEAGAQGYRRIRNFDARYQVAEDGSVVVTETIHYDFGSDERHGIERFIPVRFPYEGKGPEESVQYERVTPVDVLGVSATGASADVEEKEEDGYLLLRIGDPDETVTGEHTYTIRYQITGVFNGFPDHDELSMNVTGDRWSVPIDATTARINAPAAPSRVTCFAGPAGSRLPCDRAEVADGAALYANGPLSSYEGVTAVAAFPKGTVASTAPILEEKWSLRRAFEATPLTIAAGLALLFGGLGLVASLLWRHGRDRRFAGGPTDAAFGNDSGAERPAPLLGRDTNPVEFVPPEGIRPGHMGTLWDEQANPLDVSAMIVDLAVRGHLRIEEIEAPSAGTLGFGRREGDYRFVRLDAPRDDLLKAEALLLESLFRDGDQPLLSEMRTQFSQRLGLVEGALYDDAVALGWFPTRPDRVRARWHGLGLALLVVGVGIVYLAARFTHLGLVSLAVPVVGLALLATAGRFPRRTAKGSALLGRVRGFRELFEAGEGERQRFAEQKDVFSRYLPYAIVFGMAERWAETFASLGLTPEEMGVGSWYVSPFGYNPITFGYAMSSFSTVTTGAIAASTPSSASASGLSGFGGGGFSGGGFGGGGGGDW